MPSPVPVTRLLRRELGARLGACSSPLSSCAVGSSLRVPDHAFRGGGAARRLWSSVVHWRELQGLEPIGSGGFGLVFKARYFGETVAVKRVKSARNKLASRQSFWAELNSAHLRHKNLVRVIAATTHPPVDRAITDGIGTVIMEFAGRLNLQQVIYGDAEPPRMDQCARYSRDIACALQHLHAHSVVHLDLKPANVLLSEDGVCKLADFGCSVKIEPQHDRTIHLNEIGGTYTHRAPELLKGEKVTPLVDIYSFGVTLWQLLTREVPYEGDRQQVVYAVVAYNLRPALNRDVFHTSAPGRAFSDLLTRCWSAEPSLRPTADQLLAELSNIS
ncbi:proto-oncogene serine/threonine-protein kinase mos [Brachyhypopomus gauderio]|uniref:proto-oncogene serine/threonine-protein kinase mos n=1 Tax=Brachyhypopomus gauderio TaxID=698409 RepID=UPI004041F476